MAEAFIGGAITKLVGAVAGPIADQAFLVLNFKEDFSWLQTKLQYVTAFLQHAHGLKNEVGKKWLLDLQGIAYDAEDIVEECAVHYNSFFFRTKMGRRIRELKVKMESIMKDAEHIGLVQNICHFDQPSTSQADRVEVWKKSSLIESDARPVAIDDKVQEIINLLDDDALQVLAIVGMGGIGKTFLLQNVYNKISQKFDNAIWLSISQIYSVPRLQADIASHLDLKDKIKDVSEQRAQELIHDMLIDKKVLIVFDDVWEDDDNLPQPLFERLGIPCGTSNSCKVVITTRNKEVCRHAFPNIEEVASETYEMKLLSAQDSWNLFCLHAFPKNQQSRPAQEIEEVAHQVEKKCCGLPLAIKTVAASMARNKLLTAWQKKLRQLEEVSDVKDPIKPILRLSYDALPPVLKPCFLYFSFFGEDEEIDAERLIYLWIGESFILGEEQWSTGLSYLNQLNNLCLIEVDENREIKKTCKIHDLLRDLAIYICKENKCAFTVGEASSSACRRIFLAKNGLNTAGFKCSSSLRTLSLSQNPIKELPTKSLSDVRALRVIDLSSTDIRALPRCIGNLKLLRVLDLSQTMVVKVPDCVRNLENLYFLDVSNCPLPKWIVDLKCLQHLHVKGVDYSSKISRGISKLVSLRTFRSVDYNRLVVKDIAKLIHLQELSIDIENEEEKRSVEGGVLAQLVNMRHLTVKQSDWKHVDLKHNKVGFPDEMKAMKHLEYLHLYGFTVPTCICEYENLRVLKLNFCQWSQDPAIHTMPNLMKLELIAHREEFWDLPESFGKSGSFPQLRYITISNFQKLPDLQDGAMPRVEEFVVHIFNLKQNIPEGFEHLRSLKLLFFGLTEEMMIDHEELMSMGSSFRRKVALEMDALHMDALQRATLPPPVHFESDFASTSPVSIVSNSQSYQASLQSYQSSSSRHHPPTMTLMSMGSSSTVVMSPRSTGWRRRSSRLHPPTVVLLKEGGEYWNKIKATNPHVTIRLEFLPFRNM